MVPDGGVSDLLLEVESLAVVNVVETNPVMNHHQQIVAGGCTSPIPNPGKLDVKSLPPSPKPAPSRGWIIRILSWASHKARSIARSFTS